MRDTTLVFGWRTALLTLAIVEILALALVLARTFPNRTANRCLAALLLVLAGMLTPYAIGFAGFYDRWPWLSFAPFAVPLAVGPLVWFYTQALATGRLPPRAALHLALPALHFIYQTGSFLLPLAAKTRWDGLATPIVDPLVALGTLAGLLGYGLASLALLRRYRAFLAGQRSDDHRYAARWLSLAIAMLFVLLVARAGYELAGLVYRLDYFNTLGLYFVVAGVGLVLGVEGWRHAERPFPPIVALAEPAPAPGRDWRAQGETWVARVRDEGWHRDPALSLPGLARLLGTNASYVSRAFNEGLGTNFSVCINDLRAETVAAAIDAGDRHDLLTLALDAGFSSKASFNRAFRACFGMAPSAWRRRIRS